MSRITRTFVRGLITLLPLLITVILLIWLIVPTEKLLAVMITSVLPESWYWPGMGLVLLIGLVFLTGLLMSNFLIRELYAAFERRLDRVPLIKSIYGSIKDLQGFMFSQDTKRNGQVVVVRLGEGDRQMRLLGFLTREDFTDLPPGMGEADTVAVYLPMSYQIGGFTVMVPRRMVEGIDMTTEQALRYALTAGMSVKKADVTSLDPLAVVAPPPAPPVPLPPRRT